MGNQKLKTEIAYKYAKCKYPTPMLSYYRPPEFYTQSARCVVCSPYGKNCQNKHNIVVFILYFPHVKSDLNRCFAGGKKITTTRKHPTISVCVRRNRYKTDKMAFSYFKKVFILVLINGFQTRAFVLCLLFVDLFAKPEIHRPDVFV